MDCEVFIPISNGIKLKKLALIETCNKIYANKGL